MKQLMADGSLQEKGLPVVGCVLRINGHDEVVCRSGSKEVVHADSGECFTSYHFKTIALDAIKSGSENPEIKAYTVAGGALRTLGCSVVHSDDLICVDNIRFAKQATTIYEQQPELIATDCEEEMMVAIDRARDPMAALA